MNSITTTIISRIAATLIRRSWDIQSAAELSQARAERMEVWANDLAARWGVVDPVLTMVTREVLSR
ncbi:hypothetical protein [Bradyrhizobium sp. McL0616]|uniref:hypothetical protein n=1 Tax=Bradyrhizobium sp. McL0616 TaxID=3415674 RepID=UPI003CEBAD31